MRQLLQFCLLWSLVVCAAWAQIEAQIEARHEAGPVSTPDTRGYTARSDRRVEPYKEAPPTIGPAGSVVTDPTFGSRILRVTDAASDPRGKGRSLFTPSSAEQNSWNKTSTMFYVDTAGSSFLLYNFDPETMKSHLASAPNLPWTGEPQFSYTQPNILYGVV